MSSTASASKQREGADSLLMGARWALAGGVLAAIVALSGQWLVGQISSGWEARAMLESALPSARALGTSVVTASSTILALMLTMLGLTRQANTDFDMRFYRRIEHTGLLSSISLSGAILLLLFLSVPLQEKLEISPHWYTTIYYVVISLTAALAGLLVSIVFMLFNAMTSLIGVLRPGPNPPGISVERKEEEVGSSP